MKTLIVFAACLLIYSYGYSQNGNIGIGHTTPMYPLSFNGSLGDKISLWTDGSATHYGFGVQAGFFQMFTKNPSDRIVFGSGSSTAFIEKMRIDENGNVGIGTTSPVNFKLRTAGWISSTAGFDLTDVNANGNTSYTDAGPKITANTMAGNAELDFISPAYDAGPIAFAFLKMSGAGSPYTVDASNPLMVIKRNGNVGIGVTTPNAKLSISSNGNELVGTAASNNLRTNAGTLGTTFESEISLANIGFLSPNNSSLGIRAYRSSPVTGWEHTAILLGMDVDDTKRAGGGFLAISANGGIGIGTAAPQQSLSVSGAMNVDQNNLNIGSVNPGLSFGSASGEAIASKRNAGGNQFGLDFYTASINRMSIANGGNVGIGTAIPLQKLHVEGTTFLNGNVGIGASTPAFPISFAPLLGDKISLWSNSTNSYGFGIQGSLLQIHTDISAADIAFGYGSSIDMTEVMRIKGNGNVGIGIIAPQFPLSFNANLGDKISLWTDGTPTHYGFGIQPGLLQMFSKTNLDDIAFGFGSSGSFYERMRIINDLELGTGLELSGRIVLKNGTDPIDIDYSPGIWLHNADNSSLLGFMGTQNNQNIGFFGGTAGWGFTYDAINSRVGIGNSDPAFPLDIAGRARLRQEGSDSPGIWFNKPDNAQGSFIGQYDETNFGIWGPGATGSWKFLFDGNDGTLRIGTTEKAAGYLVNVGGRIIAEEVRVQLVASWPDYVFKDDYDLMPLAELENFIEENNRLPGFLKAEVIEKEGTDLGETQRKLMEKVEELTLYILDLHSTIKQQQTEIEKLKTEMQIIIDKGFK